MHAINMQQAAQKLPQLIQQTLENSEETVIVSDRGAVVLVDQREWKNMLETLRLFQDKTSLKALLEGHRDRDMGKEPDSVTVEEAFYAIQTEHSEKRQ